MGSGPTFAAFVIAVGALAPAAAAQFAGGAEPASLVEEARALRLHVGGKRTDGAAAEERLSPAVRGALNEWAAFAARHKLKVAVPGEAPALVVGAVDDAKALQRATDVMDRTWELLGSVFEAAEGADVAVTCFLFDRDGYRSEAWGALLEELVERNVLVPEAAQYLAHDPGGVTNRERGLFVQPTDDLAGNAAAGDDEFRLDNELAHKLAACHLRRRFGELPDTLRWGVGYVAEQRLFRGIYQFDRVGFVSASDHHGWPRRAADLLEDALDERLSARLVEADGAGRATPEQMMAWGVLDYLVAEQPPESVAALFADLAQLHGKKARYGGALSYAGDPDEAAARLQQTLAGIERKKLLKHLAKVK